MSDNITLLIEAAEAGNTEEVRRLIPITDPRERSNFALRMAAQNGHIKCVKLLIPLSDPKAKNSYALQATAYYGHPNCVDLLYPVSDVQAALQIMQNNDPNKMYWHDLEQRFLADQQNTVLLDEVASMEIIQPTLRQRKI